MRQEQTDETAKTTTQEPASAVEPLVILCPFCGMPLNISSEIDNDGQADWFGCCDNSGCKVTLTTGPHETQNAVADAFVPYLRRNGNVINLYIADSIGKIQTPMTQINISEPMPDIQLDSKKLEKLDDLYHSQAAALVNGLIDCLPVGTIDAILCALLDRRSNYVRTRMKCL